MFKKETQKTRTMKSEEKAKELVDKLGKEHALICVDEILNNDGFTRCDIYLTQYWLDVRKEIEKL